MQILEVSDVAQRLKLIIESDDLLTDLWVTGELTNVRRSAAGHYYFSIEDDLSQLRAVMFRGNVMRAAVVPEPGQAVVAHGRMTFYEAGGTCDFNVDLLFPAGMGEDQLRFEALRRQLEAEGLFAAERKRPLPRFPSSVGVVTSEQGAVLHDILTVVGRRYPLVTVVHAHSSVQGDAAPPELVDALHRLADWRDARGRRLDVVIVGRGGGAPGELAAFNDERVARAIFAAPWPVVSAVGHETDFTLCDEVADVRAPTPSAAAELVVPDRAELLVSIRTLAQRGRRATVGHIASNVAAVARLDRAMSLASPVDRVIRDQREVRSLSSQAARLVGLHIERAAGRVAASVAQLRALSPMHTLERGYAVVTLAQDHRLVRSLDQVATATDVDVDLADGQIHASVRSTTPRIIESTEDQ
jgi:exodeoxyribonuclease VII large subunit